jgi:hypothetical protein
MADGNDPFANINFDAIGQAANREEKVLSQPAVVEAIKERDDLFQVEIRRKVLGVVKTVLDVALVLFCIILVVRAYHLINPYPNRYTWLQEKDLDAIDSLLKSGVLVAAGGIARDAIAGSVMGRFIASKRNNTYKFACLFRKRNFPTH